jgi:pimeloyl-ACP methyl ester carboxylesterase
MTKVMSKDGTPIAYERRGRGPAVILVGDRSENEPLAEALQPHFTVYMYDQRGVGESGDTAPYAVEREIEDLGAIISETGGSAHVYGISAGGALVLEAAAAGAAINRLAVYEVPYGLTDGPDQWQAYRDRLDTLLAEGRRGDAFALFMRTAGSPEEDVVNARHAPIWPELEAIAHTRAYGAAVLGNGEPPIDRLARIAQPTVVITGTRIDPHMRELRPEVFDEAADTIAAAIPHADRERLIGQTHMVEATAIAPLLDAFFSE